MAEAELQPNSGDKYDDDVFREIDRRLLDALNGAQKRSTTQLAGLAEEQRQTNVLLEDVRSRLMEVHRILLHPNASSVEEDQTRTGSWQSESVVATPSLLAAPAAQPPQDKGDDNEIVGETARASSASMFGSCSLRMSHQYTTIGGLPSSWPAALQLRKDLQCMPEDEAELRSRSQRSVDFVFTPSKKRNALRDENETGLASFESGDRGKPRCLAMFNDGCTLTLDPHARVRMIIDVTSLILLLYDLVCIPVALAWDLEVTGALRTISLCVVSWWSLEVILNFFTGIYVKGKLIRNHAFIARRYLKTWFAIDVLVLVCEWTSLLLEAVVENLAGSSGRDYSAMLRILKTGRLLRLAGVAVRAARFMDIYQRTIDHLGPGALAIKEVTKLLAAILWINHLFTCLWFAAGRLLPTDTGFSWLDKRIMGSGLTYKDVSWSFQYTTAFHWSMTQMTPGSMAVTPLNTWERIINIICLLLGVLFFSSLVSTLSAKMTQHIIARQDQLKDLTTLKRFLNQKAVEGHMAMDIYKAAVKVGTVRRPLVFGDVHIISKLSHSLQIRLRYEISSPHLLKHPLFQWWSSVHEISLLEMCHHHMNFVSLASGATLFSPSSMDASYAYAIASGTMTYKQDPKSSRCLHEMSTEVYKGTWICEAAIWVHWHHVGTMDAKSPCEVMAIKAPGFVEELRKMSTLVGAIVSEYGRCFHERLIATRHPWPTDLPVQSCHFEEILTSLSYSGRVLIGSAAVNALKKNRGWPITRITDPILEKLYKEVKDETACMMVTGMGEVKRVVSVTALRIKQGDGRFFVQLGTVRGYSAEANVDNAAGVTVEARCTLPGSKRMLGAHPAKCLAQILDGTLAPLRPFLNVDEDPIVEVQERESDRQFVRTKYIRTEYDAELEDIYPFNNIVQVGMMQSRRSVGPITPYGEWAGAFNEIHAVHGVHGASAIAARTDVYLLTGGLERAALFAWLSEEDFQALRDPHSGLEHWLTHLDINSEALKQASDIFKAAKMANDLPVEQAPHELPAKLSVDLFR